MMISAEGTAQDEAETRFCVGVPAHLLRLQCCWSQRVLTGQQLLGPLSLSLCV
jgi:hypothetical protein